MKIVILTAFLFAIPLSAQTTVAPPASVNATDCTLRIIDTEGKPGVSACEPAGRLAFLLKAETFDVGQLWIAVESGAAQRGILAVKLAKGVPADSELYGIVEILHFGQSGYRINTSVGGKKAKPEMCESFGGTIPGDWPVVLGAMISSAAVRLTRCLQPLKLALP